MEDREGYMYIDGREKKIDLERWKIESDICMWLVLDSDG